jgi:membrane fusion protein
MTENKVRSIFRKNAALHQEQNARLYCPVFATGGPKKNFLVVSLSLVMVTLLYCIGWIEFDDTEIFRGALRLDQDTVKVAPSRDGVYENVFVKNGQEVARGELLATVKSVESDQKGDDTTLRDIKLEEQRITNIEEQVEIANFSFDALRDSLRISIISESERVEYLNTDLQFAEKAERLLRDEYQRSKLLESEGHASTAETNRKSLALLGAQQQLNEVKRAIMDRSWEIQKLEQQITIEGFKYAERAAKLDFSLAQLESNLLRKTSKRQFSLVAPIGGVVSSLLPHGNRTAASGLPLLSLVPSEAKLEAIVYVSQDARGLVQEKQEVKLLFDTFPSGHFGFHLAIIESINSEAIDPRLHHLADTSITQPFFLAYADISQNVIRGGGNGKQISLRSDLQFNAEVIVGRRTILERIIAPLKRFESRVL